MVSEISYVTCDSEEDILLADIIASQEVIQNQATLEMSCETYVSEEDTLLPNKKDTSYTSWDTEFQVLTMKSSSLDNVSGVIVIIYSIILSNKQTSNYYIFSKYISIFQLDCFGSLGIDRSILKCFSNTYRVRELRFICFTLDIPL